MFAKHAHVALPDKPLGKNKQLEVVALDVRNDIVAYSRTDGSLRVWRVVDGDFKGGVVENAHDKVVSLLALLDTDQQQFYVATVAGGPIVRRWKSGQVKMELHQDREVRVGGELTVVAAAHDGKLVVVDRVGHVLVLARDWSVLSTHDHGERVFAAKWFHSNRHFMLASQDGSTAVYELNTLNKVVKIGLLERHRSACTAVALAPLGKTIAVGSNDGAVSYWELRTLGHDQVLADVDEPVAAVDINEDGLLAVSFDCRANTRVYRGTELVYEVPESATTTSCGLAAWMGPERLVYTSDKGRAVSLLRPETARSRK